MLYYRMMSYDNPLVKGTIVRYIVLTIVHYI